MRAAYTKGRSILEAVVEQRIQTRMKNTVHTLSALALLAATSPVQAQTFGLDDVQFWTGTGPDSALLVIDFHDGTPQPSYAWGYLHDGTATAADMLTAIATADPQLTVEIGGGFLSDITYMGHAGIGGAPNWWSTWSGTSLADLAMNLGISEPIANGSWFGCSYEPYDPDADPTGPTEPVAAQLPVGVHDHIAAGAWTVFPQPATDRISIPTEASVPLPVALCSTPGQRVQAGRTGGMLTTIDVRGLAAGPYVLQVGEVRRTIVVQ